MKNRLKETNGKEFQEIFTMIMKEKHGIDFQQVESYGNLGDKKVDGLLIDNIAYQVYAPEVYKEAEVKKKIKSDFKGFMHHREKEGYWKNAKEIIFVIKTNRNNGITPEIWKTVQDLKSEYNFSIKLMTLKDIYQIVDSLSSHKNDKHVNQLLISKILRVKYMYTCLYKEGQTHNGDGNLLLIESEEENNEKRIMYIDELNNLKYEIDDILYNKFSQSYNPDFEGKLKTLIELLPAFNGSIINLPEFYKILLNKQLYTKITTICTEISEEANRK